MKETIRTFTGSIIGYIETQSSGDKIVTDFYGRKLGSYRKRDNATLDFYGKILYYGDMSSALLIKK